MKRILFLLLSIIPVTVLSQNYISKEDSIDKAWKAAIRKAEYEDSMRIVNEHNRFVNKVTPLKKRYIGKIYYLRKTQGKYRQNTPFECVDITVDKNKNVLMHLVNQRDTLSMEMDFWEYSEKLNVSSSFKDLFYQKGGSRNTAIDYKTVVSALYVGMSKKSVLYIMGNPKSQRTTITDNAEILFWEYPNNIYLTFLNGKLKVIQK